jgi:hypothetical protein
MDRARRYKYEAISYVWGDASDTTQIVCSVKLLVIPKSLETALKRFRHFKTSRILWADAICINQNDIQERNHQVDLMSRIYSDAECVLAWLEDEERLAWPAFAYIRKLSRAIVDITAQRYRKAYNYKEARRHKHAEHCLPPLPSDTIPLIELQNFTRHPFFSLSWIQQEIGLARMVVFNWGTQSITYAEILRVVGYLSQHMSYLELDLYPLRGPLQTFGKTGTSKSTICGCNDQR